MIESEHLIITPLTYNQLLKYIKLDGSLEVELGVEPVRRVMSDDFKDAIEKSIIPAVANPDNNYLYYTLWTILSKTENRVIGDLCFMGEPNDKGEIEIGYGTYPDYQNKGFMTEAVAETIKWIKKDQPAVTSIIAFTRNDNPASYAVLKKNEFVKVAETGLLLKWKLALL
ncbi:MAG: GNAT family N-acetyltransferase [Prevotellaceae bacterium]|nr:GNAT family N-acetyltransferase [Prevotellaceae bacterium]